MIAPAPARARRRWAHAEDRAIVRAWGEVAIPTLARTLGRTVTAVVTRARRLGLGPADRGAESVDAFARRIGHDRTAVLTAVERLGLRLRPVARSYAPERRHQGRYRHHVVSEEQAERILAHLAEHGGAATARELWGTGGKPAVCRRHGGTDRPHHARGLCRPCYTSSRLAGQLEQVGVRIYRRRAAA